MRDNPYFARNAALLQSLQTIQSADEWQRRCPPPAHEPPPWASGARIAFLTIGHGTTQAPAWAARLQTAYGVTVPLLQAALGAVAAALSGLNVDALVGFVGDAASHDALAAEGHTVALLVVDDGGPVRPWPDGAPPMILARHAGSIAAWRQAGYPVWHRPWEEAAGDAAAPVLVQPLSHLLASPRAWQVRIVIDRAAVTPSAFDSAPFWYVGLHDEQDTELLREDLRGTELHHAVTAADGPIVISRALRSTRRPTRWTVWPTDRRGYWLDKLSGEIAPDALSHGDGA